MYVVDLLLQIIIPDHKGNQKIFNSKESLIIFLIIFVLMRDFAFFFIKICVYRKKVVTLH